MRLLFGFALLLSFLLFQDIRSNAQNAKVLNAYNYNRSGELDKARENIDMAIENEDTKVKAKTWVYRGETYKALYRSKDEKYKNLDPQALVKGYESYKKAAELDTKGQYKEQTTTELKNSRIEFTNEAILAYNAKNFQSSLANSEYAIQAASLPQVNVVDTVAYKVAGLSALNLNNNEKARTYLRKLVELKYEVLNSYLLLSDSYLAEKDTTGYLAIIQEARKQFPSNNDLATKEINIYIVQNKVPQAIENINTAIKNDPTNYVLYSNLGILYQKTNELDKAEATYKQAIEIKPDGFDALYNLGALYYNAGVEKIKIANELPRNQTAKYNELTKKSNELFVQSKPYIEKALAVSEAGLAKDPSNSELLRNKRDALTSLKLLYYNLNDDAKYQEADDKLKNL